MAALEHTLHAKGSTGLSRAYIRNLTEVGRAEIEFEVEAVGGTPTVTFSVQGLLPGGNPATEADWVTLAVLTHDATVAANAAPITVTAVGKTRRYVAGLVERFFDALAINVTANTNVTYSSRLKVDHSRS